MRQTYLALLSGIILIVILGMSWCSRNPAPPLSGSPTPMPTAAPTAIAAPTPSAAPSATATPTITPSPTPAPMISPSAELKKASAKIAPAVILVTTFDPSGKLLRTGTGFFAERDGRLITTLALVQDATYAVAKSSDGKIRNVTGVIASSPAAGLVVLKAETKTGVPFVSLSKTGERIAPVALVSSSLQHREQPLGAIQITGRETGVDGELLTTSASVPIETSGAPLVDENGEIIGIVTVATQPNQSPRVVVRPATAIASLLAQTRSDSAARWLVAGNETPTPTPAPKGRVVYNPPPMYPQRARSARPPLFGSGRFRIIFDTTGQVKEVQIIRSTGQPVLDQAAIDAFRNWKSTPGQEWSLAIPITFQP